MDEREIYTYERTMEIEEELERMELEEQEEERKRKERQERRAALLKEYNSSLEVSIKKLNSKRMGLKKQKEDLVNQGIKIQRKLEENEDTYQQTKVSFMEIKSKYEQIQEQYNEIKSSFEKQNEQRNSYISKGESLKKNIQEIQQELVDIENELQEKMQRKNTTN